MLVRTDLAELWDLRDESKAVLCVQHEYRTRAHDKYLGARNQDYPRKNWSSVMLWNCAHPANRTLTPDFIQRATGAQLHRFTWLGDELIGKLPIEWNWLPDELGHNHRPSCCIGRWAHHASKNSRKRPCHRSGTTSSNVRARHCSSYPSNSRRSCGLELRPHDARHRRRRLHRLELRARLARASRTSRSSTSTSSPTPATCATSARSQDDARHVFVRGDIGDRALVEAGCCERHRPRAIVHFAAESHVDRSIRRPGRLHRDQHRRHVRAARGGARVLGRAAGRRARRVPLPARLHRRGLRLARPGRPGVHRDARRTRRTARTRRRKAAADHLVRAYHHTYGLPALTTNCSNNYGPYQFPEKLIPLMIRQRARGQAAAGLRRRPAVRDWLYVEDHCDAHPRGARARPARRDLQHRRQQREERTSTSCARSARSSTSAARAAGALRAT